MKNTDEYKRIERLVRGSTQDLTDVAVAEIVEAWQTKGFKNSCVWHEAHAWHVKNTYPKMKICDICNGRVSSGYDRHYICEERQKRGLPTPTMDASPKCGCKKCEP